MQLRRSVDGGRGGDTLTGGLDDTFIWESTADSAGSIPSGIDFANTDVILDFDFAEGDRIDVQGVDANEPLNGNQAFTFIGEHNTVGGFTAPGQIAYINSGGDTFLIFNTDNVFHIGNTADFEMAIRLDGTYTPNAFWFDL